MKTNVKVANIFIALLLTSSSFTAPAQDIKDKDIVIAIIDTGAEVTHPLIKENIWENPREIINGIDDDGNGFVDDVHGWNFVAHNNELTDNNGHGTHIAGIIQQRTQNAHVKYMILKYYDSGKTGEDNVSATVKAIQYATKMKVDIINYSGGGYDRNPTEEKAIREAQKQGILFVAAAGNGGLNTDTFGYYPASYKVSNIISVAAMDSQKRLIASSNYGSSSVDIAAPGKRILSSLPGGQYGYMTGTSQATAWVTGLAANLMLQKKTYVPEEIKRQLEVQGTRDLSLANKTKSQVRISALQESVPSL
ncbi:S8 family peptidase [Bdellovibrio svalbardensis]|uniref:S8 family serine peptidase n=1 Tax=Bdellovibrio svalbardensis TaxID=2972972 RepID=A0ABT6DL92_9BACT|nr:S8 family peptidase [Bdellovibrio svalbardensis]MDG0817588.1 S8 family serine peptidase [Bdellovibrio svalbardensis]